MAASARLDSPQEVPVPSAELLEKLTDSPLSQIPPEELEPESRFHFFTRDEDWLEAATNEMKDINKFPLGQLSVDDVESIAGIMAAWARRRSVEAALVVESLLKRVVDDMKANNTDIQVNTRLYTIAIDAWAKSGAKGTARRAQHIHDAMVQMYKETKDRNIAPSSISYNTLMNAWGKSPDPEAPVMAERVLQEMINSGKSELKPDAITFSTILDSYARSKDWNATQRAEELFHLMDELGVKRNVYTFSALQNVYARSGKQDAPLKAEKILNRMLDLYEKGDIFAKPNCVNYNAVLNAYSRTPRRASTEAAVQMLQRMELPVSEGGFDVEPDRLSYAMTILACARCPDEVYGSRMAEKNLEKMEIRAKKEAQRRQEVSSAAPPSVVLDIECFNVVLTAISKSRQPDAVNRTIAIVQRMDQYADEGQDSIRPSVRSWNAVLNALSRSREQDSAVRAEGVLNHMYNLHQSGLPVKPDAFTFAAVLSAHQKSSDPQAVDRADAIVRRMEELYERGEIDTPPDVYHYTIVCSAWARSRRRMSSQRCLQILAHMIARYNKGYEGLKPNVRTYNAVLDCLSKNGEEENAEQLLFHMLRCYDNGDEDAKPDEFSFNSVINVFTRSKKKGSGRRAEAILERFLEYSLEENPDVKPDARSFTHIISHYGRSKELDAPYRAEYLLNRMVALFKSGHRHLAPNTFAITTVMDSYSYAKHPDSGRVAERLLKIIYDLQNNYDASKLSINSSVYNSVLFAWASCGDDDAGRHAEMHLDDMERKYETGNLDAPPSARSYGLVLNAWSKSSSFDKAERSLKILRRMEKRLEGEKAVDGESGFQTNEHAYSLVINACAFTNSGAEAQVNAFKIAVSIMDEMLQSEQSQPTSLTYGWFIQACGRLNVPESERHKHIERAFTLCCKNGLVNDFVLNRLKGAAPNTLFQKLIYPALLHGNCQKDLSSDTMYSRIYLNQLPYEWSRKCSKRKNDNKRNSKSKANRNR